MSNVNMIFGVSSRGEFYYTVNYGTTNSDTYFLYIMKLAQRLYLHDRHWRDNTILMMDNAPYHRSAVNMQRYSKHRIPIMFLGPYHFKLAPVEMMFSYIKD
jgi:transposase